MTAAPKTITSPEAPAAAVIAGAAPCSANLTLSEREQIATILSRRANEVAGYSDDNRDKMPASVDYALELEMKRLRRLADKVRPPQPETDDE